MKTRFTPEERIVAGVYVGLIALLVNTLFGMEFVGPLYLIYVFFCGLACGATIIPYCLIPNKHLVLRALGAGCLATVATAILAGFYLPVTDMGLRQLLTTDLKVFSKLFTDLIYFSIATSVAGLIASVIGAPATVLFSNILAKRRRKIAPEFRPDVFD